MFRRLPGLADRQTLPKGTEKSPDSGFDKLGKNVFTGRYYMEPVRTGSTPYPNGTSDGAKVGPPINPLTTPPTGPFLSAVSHFMDDAVV